MPENRKKGALETIWISQMTIMLRASSTVTSVRPSILHFLFDFGDGLLRLISAKSVVEVLSGGRLGPLRVGLLTPSIASSALRATVSHGRSAIARGGSSLRSSVVTGLAAVLSNVFKTVS